MAKEASFWRQPELLTPARTDDVLLWALDNDPPGDD